MSTETFEFLRSHLGVSVPFAAHTGVELTSVGDGVAVAVLPEAPHTLNHIASQHAGALFTAAEAASGAAMAGALADQILSVRPLVRTASVAYRKVARGPITATAVTSQPGSQLRADLESAGRIEFDVDVTLTDSADLEVASVRVEWVVTQQRPTAP